MYRVHPIYFPDGQTKVHQVLTNSVFLVFNTYMHIYPYFFALVSSSILPVSSVIFSSVLDENLCVPHTNESFFLVFHRMF